MSFFSDDAVYHALPRAPVVGKTAIRDFVARHVEQGPRRMEIHVQLALDGVVINERTDYGVVRGRPVVVPICGVFEVEGRTITSWREYFDTGPFRAP